MTVILLILLICTALYVIGSKDLLYAAIALSAFSVLSAVLFFTLGAPDVAITEAAVGAGISTIICVWAIKSTARDDSL